MIGCLSIVLYWILIQIVPEGKGMKSLCEIWIWDYMQIYYMTKKGLPLKKQGPLLENLRFGGNLRKSCTTPRKLLDWCEYDEVLLILA